MLVFVLADMYCLASGVKTVIPTVLVISGKG